MSRTAPDARAVETDLFERAGRRLRGHRTGPSQAIACVLVHGIGTGSRTFRRLVPELAAARRSVAIDLPGFAGLPKPPERMSVEDHADFLTDYLDTLGGPPATLIGHSMGTQIVAASAARRPDLVERIVLIGPVTKPDERSARMHGLRLAQDTMGETPATNWTVFSDYARCGLRWYLANLPSMLDYDLPGVLARLAVPSLVIRGADDPIAPHEWASALAALTPRATLVEIPMAHHVAMFTHPRLVARAIDGWAARTP